MRILVVDDERRLAETIADILKEHKYTVDLAYDGEAGLDQAMTGIYDAVIMDVMMPRLNGYDAVRALRKSGCAVPVLMLTAKTETLDKVTGLDVGADYYLTKPFETDELLACVRALLRRQGEVVTDELCFGGTKLNLMTCTLSYGERSVRLSAREFDLMRILIANRGNIISKETLLTKVWGYETDAEENSVEVYVSFLRKKLNHIKSDVAIESVRRIGYHLEATHA